MDVRHLTRDQQVALVGLLEAVALSDGTISDGELVGIDRLTADIGEDAYRRLMEEADDRFPDLATLKEGLLAVADRDVRDLIYGLAMEESMAAPSTAHGKAELLDWLAGEWGIEVDEAPEE